MGNSYNGRVDIYAVCPKRHGFFTNHNLHTFEFIKRIDTKPFDKYDEYTGKKL